MGRPIWRRAANSCAVIEGQDALVKVLAEHAGGHGLELGSTSASRKHSDAGENFGLADRRREERPERLLA